MTQSINFIVYLWLLPALLQLFLPLAIFCGWALLRGARTFRQFT